MSSVDIESLMLSAMIGNKTDIQTTLSLEDMKIYLRRHIDSLSIAERRCIGSILIAHDLRIALSECAEGTVINLDAVGSKDPKIIQQMYDLMKFNREQSR